MSRMIASPTVPSRMIVRTTMMSVKSKLVMLWQCRACSPPAPEPRRGPHSIAPTGRPETETADTQTFVAEHDGEVVGIIVTRIAADEAEILNLAVLPTLRRRGLARGLILTALAAARALNARRAFLEVRESNLGARAFYSRMGFIEFGRRRAYYQGTRRRCLDSHACLGLAALQTSCRRQNLVLSFPHHVTHTPIHPKEAYYADDSSSRSGRC